MIYFVRGDVWSESVPVVILEVSVGVFDEFEESCALSLLYFKVSVFVI